MAKVEIPEYTCEDFEGTAPYEFLYSYRDDPFLTPIITEKLAEAAKKVGFKSFNRAYKGYIKKTLGETSIELVSNVTMFTGQALELDSGKWYCDDDGVYLEGMDGKMYACPHPIMPVERLTNIDTLAEKLVLSYSRGGKWRSLTVGKEVLASASKITELAAYGIAVNSDNAKLLARYITDVEAANYNYIPEKNSVSRVGYIKNEGFAPYVDNLIFDGDKAYGRLFDSIKSNGDYDIWKQEIARIRRESVVAKILVAASFASVLVQPLGANPFFVHLWGGESGTGKTVGLMAAASVWANPERGAYIQTFNSTDVGHERLAAFLNSLPVCIDELQLARDKRGNVNFNVYQLAQGVGRTRGNKSGGVDITPTWGNCIITTGESPLTAVADGAGALNRVIEIECKTSCKVVQDGVRTSGILKQNYGFAGKAFIDNLLFMDGMRIDGIAERYREYMRRLVSNDATEKQASAAALLIVADECFTQWILTGEQPLTEEEISEFLKSNAEASIGQRGYDYLCDWIVQNANRFNADSDDNKGEIYGVMETDSAGIQWAYIINNTFREALKAAGMSEKAVVAWMDSNGYLRRSGKKNTYTVVKRIKGALARCIAVRMPSGSSDDDNQYFDELL